MSEADDSLSRGMEAFMNKAAGDATLPPDLREALGLPPPGEKGFGLAHPRMEGMPIHPDDLLYTVYWTEEEYQEQLKKYVEAFLAMRKEAYGEAEGA